MLGQPFNIPGQAPGVQGTRLCHLLSDEALLRRLTGNTSEDCVSALRSLNLPDSFWTDEFKVVNCLRTYAHKWTLCPCAHIGETARRRCPRTVNYKAVLCPLVKAKKTCPLGDACTYAHNVFEHWLHPSRYKTRLCSFGRNCNRSICFFAHSAEELRCVPCTDDKEGDEREYLMQILIAQENGLLPGMEQPMQVPPAPMPPLLPTLVPDFGSALQHALQQPLPPSARTSVNGLPDAATIMSARQSMNGVAVAEYASARASLSGMPTDRGAVAMLRASMSGVADPHSGGMMLRGRPSMNGLPDRNASSSTAVYTPARASMNGLPDGGGYGRSRPSLNGLPDATNMLLSMGGSMQRGVSSSEMSAAAALNAANMQRAMSNDLGMMQAAAAAAAAAPFTAAASMQHALSGADLSGAAPLNAIAMERAFSRELAAAASAAGNNNNNNNGQGSISPVQPAGGAYAGMAAAQRDMVGMGLGGTNGPLSSGSLDREHGAGGVRPRDLSSLTHAQSINSVESDSLIQLRGGAMGGMGPVGGAGSAVLGGFGTGGALAGFEAALGNAQAPQRLSDPGANFHMAMSAGGFAASHTARVSDSGNKLGMMCGRDLHGLESLLPLVNNALASGALALPLQPGTDMMRRSNSGSNNSGRGLSPPLQEQGSAGSPSHSGSLTPLSSNSVGEIGGPADGSATAGTGLSGSPPRTHEGAPAFEGMYMAAAAAAAAGGGGGGVPLVGVQVGGGGVDQSYLSDLVARLQDQGVNKDQLVSSLSQLLAQLLSVQ